MNRMMRHCLCATAVFVFLLLGLPYRTSQGQALSGPAESSLQGLTFRNIGPATMGGRVDDLAVMESRPSVFYAATATGGLWKTVNNGTTWKAEFEHEDVVSIGAVAIPRDDASLVWVGTGEDNNRQSSSWGGGVFKSTDGGETWKNLGLAETEHIGRIVIDPIDHDVVYVAATGHLWGPNPERGVYKTTDGGLTWTRVLSVDNQTGATDLVMDPVNNKVLYAAMYQRQRSAWGFNGGGPGSGIYKSTDAGRTWSKLTTGIPDGPLGRIGLDIYRKDPNILYALIEHDKEGGLYRSEDAGAHWTKMSNTNPRPMYFSQVRIDPTDANRVYVVGVFLLVSDDGGKTFASVRLSSVPHSPERPREDRDIHALWIDQENSAHLVIGCDAGIAVSYDRGVSWDYINNLPIGQFYHVGYDMDVPYNVYGGLQDNDVWFGPSAVRNVFGIANADWHTTSIGDGMVALADPSNSRVLYSGVDDGGLVRVDRETYERKTIRPEPAMSEPPFRWAWNSPLVLSPHDPNIVFTAANVVFKSTDRGQSWTAISPDLTSKADRDKLTLMGVSGKDIKLSKDDGVSAYPTIVAFAESPKKAGLYYAGSDDGLVHLSPDGGKTWENLTGKFPGLPSGAAVSALVPSAFDEATAYAAFNNHRADDFKPYVYFTADYGKKWTPITSTLPPNQTVNCLTEDPKNSDVLYLGTEFGLFVSLDRGHDWIRFHSNLPTVPIDEIAIQPRDDDMLLATHGRSIWILDDIAPIQHFAEAIKSSAYLFDIRPASQFNPSDDRANYPGDRSFWGQNPEFGAAITYYLDRPAKQIELTVRDASGAILRRFSNDDLKNYSHAGTDRVYWDLRHQPLEPPSTDTARGPGGGFGGGGLEGPFVLPGAYHVTLTVNGHEVATRAVQVDGDRLIPISDADRKTAHDTALSLHELQGTANLAAADLRQVDAQMRSIEQLLKQASNPPPSALKSSADDLQKRTDELAKRLGIRLGSQPDQAGAGGFPTGLRERPLLREIGSLKNEIMDSTSLPTEMQLREAREAREGLSKLVGELDRLMANTLPALYQALFENKVTPAPLKPIPSIPVSPPGQM